MDGEYTAGHELLLVTYDHHGACWPSPTSQALSDHESVYHKVRSQASYGLVQFFHERDEVLSIRFGSLKDSRRPPGRER